MNSNRADLGLTAPADGVWFDIIADGVPRLISWTDPMSNVGFLVLDRNGNGMIDSGAELFGSNTPISSGGNAEHGFQALEDLDGGPDGSDGVLSADDSSFGQLRFWLDRNHDGISQSSELLTMDQAGIKMIFTDSKVRKYVDQHGNRYFWEGRAIVQQRGRLQRRRVFDVILKAIPLS